MLLLDSLHINNSGGYVLLRYLISQLERQSIDVFYLIDSRCAFKFIGIPNERKCIMAASIYARYKWYKANNMRFSKILCFGNIPPPIKTEAIVYTYFHNINLLNIPKTEQFKTKILSRLKRFVFKKLKVNTNYWIVQTSNTKSELVSHLSENDRKVLILPFYDIKGVSANSLQRSGFVYASNYVKQKNFELVVEAWLQMALKGFTPTLHLTLGNAPVVLLDAIKLANAQGANIINHGFLSHNELFDLYRKTKALVYAATNESLGLCLIEALENGCDVIAPDLPYVHSICDPSETFDLKSLESLIQAIRRYQKESKKSMLLVENKIKELISLIC